MCFSDNTNSTWSGIGTDIDMGTPAHLLPARQTKMLQSHSALLEHGARGLPFYFADNDMD